MNFLKKQTIIRPLILLAALATFGIGSYYWFYLPPKTKISQLEPAHIIPNRYLDQSKRNHILIGNIITLKTLREDYIEAYHDMFSADVRKGLSFTAAVDDEAFTIDYVTWLLNRQAKGELMAYAIFDNADKILVGAVQICAHHSNDPGQLACWINDKYRGGGRIQEAFKLITDEYFRMTNAPVLSAFVEPFNARSYKALTKFGFKEKYNKDRYNRKKHKKDYLTLELDNPHLKH